MDLPDTLKQDLRSGCRVWHLVNVVDQAVAEDSRGKGVENQRRDLSCESSGHPQTANNSQSGIGIVRGGKTGHGDADAVKIGFHGLPGAVPASRRVSQKCFTSSKAPRPNRLQTGGPSPPGRCRSRVRENSRNMKVPVALREYTVPFFRLNMKALSPFSMKFSRTCPGTAVVNRRLRSSR